MQRRNPRRQHRRAAKIGPRGVLFSCLEGRGDPSLTSSELVVYAEGVAESPVREELVGEMRRWGVRVTAQRLAVAEVLIASRDHPSAPEVYGRVRSQFPHITMSTVYNTINILAKSGFIQLLSFPHGTRYETNRSPHANLVCVRCGAIVDAADTEGWVGRLREQVTSTGGFQVMSQRVDFYGVCTNCTDDENPAG